MKASNVKITVMHTTIVNDISEAMNYYQDCRDLGEEGAMFKNMESVWEPKRSKNIGKMKAEEVADLRVVSWYHGEAGKQFEHGLGGYVCETSDGLLRVNVGGGYSQDYRLQDTEVFDDMVGSIISVTYNEVISDKKTGMHSLFLPRVDSNTEWVRVDKDEANALGELK